MSDAAEVVTEAAARDLLQVESVVMGKVLAEMIESAPKEPGAEQGASIKSQTSNLNR